MMSSSDVDQLVREYQALLSKHASHDLQAVQATLVGDGDWTPQAAEHLVRLAQDYGSFMLRNALAVALALDIEDGELGF